MDIRFPLSYRRSNRGGCWFRFGRLFFKVPQMLQPLTDNRLNHVLSAFLLSDENSSYEFPFSVVGLDVVLSRLRYCPVDVHCTTKIRF